MAEAEIQIFGIRHHGPGSARSLATALAAFGPDCVLIEGPPDANEILALANHEAMKPPVAILVYDPETPAHAVFYPFATFSPEWQAIQYALQNKVALSFIDFPQKHRFAIDLEEQQMAKAAATCEKNEEAGKEGSEPLEPDNTSHSEEQKELPELDIPSLPSVRKDPLGHLARAAGYLDSEQWWEAMVEHRKDPKHLFTAIMEAMCALRDGEIIATNTSDELEEARREAHMRQMIREAKKDGHTKIAVVCGAWHAPVLTKLDNAKSDAALLKGLPKRKVASTWIPWTYSRLSNSSGYGAGITSPGWYDFLWNFAGTGGNLTPHWLVSAAKLLRNEDLDASSASVIEAVRLAETLAALRNRPQAALPEMNEAIQTVLCFGDRLPMQLVSDKLIISERLGEVPAETPAVPLAQDLAKEQKRLRLPVEATSKVLDLDLRKPNDLDRSHLFHRLNLLDIPWAQREDGQSRGKGTFHEHWTIQWEPEFALKVIEAAVWGNNVENAASGKIIHKATEATELPAITDLVDSTLLADLPQAATHLMNRLQSVAALATDIGHLMGALGPLANVLRYGNVRQTDASMVGKVVDGLITRICIGLPVACGSLNDEAAANMLEGINRTHAAVVLLQKEEHLNAWKDVLQHLSNAPSLHGLIAGRSCHLLLERGAITSEDAARRLSLALSAANPPDQSAAWVEGFLAHQAMWLLHDDVLWSVLDDWVRSLKGDHFTNVLPLLRRTFATFSPAERRQLGSRAVSGKAPVALKRPTAESFDEARAARALPLTAQLLGLKILDQPAHKT